MHDRERSLAIDDLLALPPGFRLMLAADDPWAAALRAAARGAEPGCVFWDRAQDRCRAAFVLAPDRPLQGVGEVLDLGALAVFDALASLAPPQVPMHLIVPDGLAVDGGRVATLQVEKAAAAPGAVPEWAVLGIDIAVNRIIAANCITAAPGDQPDQTCLHEEGFGDVTAADVLTHTCRHLLNWLDAWQQDGPASLARIAARRTRPDVVAA